MPPPPSSKNIFSTTLKGRERSIRLDMVVLFFNLSTGEAEAVISLGSRAA